MSSPTIRGDGPYLNHATQETEAGEPGGTPASDVAAEKGAGSARPPSYIDGVGSECVACREEVERIVLRAVRNPALVKDVVDEAILRLIASGGLDAGGEKVRNVPGYLIRASHRLALDELRRKSSPDRPQNVSLSSAAGIDLKGVTLDPAARSFAERVEDDDTMKAMLGALSALTPEERALIRMRFVEGKSARDIAEKLEVVPATVRNRLKNLYRKMRSVVDGRA